MVNKTVYAVVIFAAIVGLVTLGVNSSNEHNLAFAQADQGNVSMANGSDLGDQGNVSMANGSDLGDQGNVSMANGSDQSDIVQASIVPGATTLTDTAVDPNPIEITVGQTVVWTNDDTAFHTVTSGLFGAADAGQLFDSGLAGPTALTSKGTTFEHTFDTAGEYDYHCTLHPLMTGEIIVT
jgi:plastocyanin